MKKSRQSMYGECGRGVLSGVKSDDADEFAARCQLEVFIILGFLCAFIWWGLGEACCYKVNGVVKEVKGKEILVEDRTGRQWKYEGFGYNKKDKVVIKFDDNGTDTERNDDKVIDVISLETDE